MDEDRALQPVLGLELREQAVDVVDVPRALDLRDHDHVEPVADLADERDQVVEHPRRVERVHARPQRGAAEVDLAADRHEAGARGLLAVGRDRVLEVAEQDVGRRAMSGSLAAIFSFDGSKKWIIRDGVTGISSSGSGAPWASGLAKTRGLRIQAHRTGAPAQHGAV